MTELICLTYSPWSIKARWALEHHQVPFKRTEHMIMLGEPALRLKTRRFAGRVTVPVLIHEGEVLADSYAIAQWAERRGGGPPLFPKERLKAIDDWNRTSEAVADCARALVSYRTLSDPEAVKANLPPFAPEPLRPMLTGMVSMAVKFLESKYGFREDQLTERRHRMREGLLKLRAGLAGGDHLCGGAFTYADIAMAVTLQAVKPVDHPTVRLGAAVARSWTDPAFAAEFPDLLEWRDRLFAKFR
jgi:glutathione S-transferase